MVDANRSDVALLYRRAGFGRLGSELDQLAPAGYQAAVDQVIGELTAPAATNPPPTTGNVKQDVATLQQWWLHRMITSTTPLQEKLALYWHGHFATGVSKVRDTKLMYLQNQLFRSAGGGGFEPLMQAVAKDGAMMIWLDTDEDKATHPNENFAREMMELFTLGVGNYTQADVTAAARGFTGWVYNRQEYTYEFRPRQHDYGTKTYLGQTGNWNGDDIVHIAVTRPESPRFIVARVWSHFAHPVAPTDPIVTDLLPSYATVGTLLKAVFLHPSFLSDASRTGLVKQPAEWLAGAARALSLNAETVETVKLNRLSADLGQTLFDPPNVGGWGQNAYWLDTATADVRLAAGLRLAEQGDLSPVADQPASAQADAAADLLGLDGWSPTTAAALGRLAGRPIQLTALALASPEYVLA